MRLLDDVLAILGDDETSPEESAATAAAGPGARQAWPTARQGHTYNRSSALRFVSCAIINHAGNRLGSTFRPPALTALHAHMFAALDQWSVGPVEDRASDSALPPSGFAAMH